MRKARPKVIICDDQQKFLDSFRQRHRNHYDIKAILNSGDLLSAIDNARELPDLIILDLYFSPNDTPEENKISAAEGELRKLDEQIEAAKVAVLEAWEPRGIELLKWIRARYPASALPVVVFTQKGLLLLDDEQIRTVEENEGHWLLKGRLSAVTEQIRLDRIISYYRRSESKKIFIGHGRSDLWTELRDYLCNQLALQCEEFNAEPPAGIPTFNRLLDMLDNSRFAFLVMTGEDEHSDSLLHARENVIHEIGLFQGRLGPRKAIILLEEGCREFTNIEGLTRIHFPKGSVSAAFPEVKRVLEREAILTKK